MSGIDDIPLPSPKRRPIKINRRCLGNSTPSHTDAKNETGYKDIHQVYDGAEPDAPSTDKTVTKTNHGESQGKVVDDFLKKFLAQKMAIIEKERYEESEKHIPKPEKSINVKSATEEMEENESHEGVNLEVPKKGQSQSSPQDMTSGPFRDFLLKKMALIEAEREEINKRISTSDSRLVKSEGHSKSCLPKTQVACKESLEKKMAGIEKACEIAEKKALEMAKESSKPLKIVEIAKHKSSKCHKKDKKREHKEKKKDKHKSRSRSRSREKERDKKSKHKDKHRDKDCKSKHKEKHKDKDRHKCRERKGRGSQAEEPPMTVRHKDDINNSKDGFEIKLPQSHHEDKEKEKPSSNEKLHGIIKPPEGQTKSKISAEDHAAVIEGPTERTSGAKPVTGEPVTEQAATKQSLTDQSLTDQSLTDQSLTDQAPSDQAPSEQAPNERALADQAVTQQTRTEQTWTEQTWTEQTLPEQTRTDQGLLVKETKSDPLVTMVEPKTETIESAQCLKLKQEQTEHGDQSKTVQPAPKEEPSDGAKKKVMGPIKLGIKISQTSADLIQSGRRLDLEAKTMHLEEGEIEDTDGAGASSELTTEMSTDLTSSTFSDDDHLASQVKHKKKKSKHKKKKKKHKTEKERSVKRKTSNSRSKTPKKRRHSRSRSRSRSRSYERRKSRSRSHDRLKVKRSRSRSRHRDDHGVLGGRRERRSRSRERGRDRWGLSRVPGAPPGRNRRSRSRERRGTTEDLRLKIDKAKLREIAIANAYANMQTGQGPPLILKADDIAAIKAGGKSVEELTNFCKKISQKEGDISSTSESDGQLKGSDDDVEGPFIHHPFKVRDPQPNIVMNIRNAKQLPVQTPAEKMAQSSTLRLQFPVSSGSHHRDKEDEWVPVEKTTGTIVPAVPPAPPVPVVVPPTTTPVPPQPAAQATPGVFPEPPEQPINIGAIVSERLSALRKLQDNPNDVVAIGTMYKAQQQMNQWAASKQLPGQFTGTTGVQVLSQEQLSGLDRHHQAWIKKDQFTRAAPVKSGIGMYLLQKMGWKQGEGLGKNKEGQKEPLLLDFKTDRKGLTSSGESVRKNPTPPSVKDLAGKHPVSALVELCTKKRWGSPEFVLVHESGPDHKKNFLYKVLINNSEYQASVASTNKKHAKAQAATVCLQDLGLVPRTASITTPVSPDTPKPT